MSDLIKRTNPGGAGEVFKSKDDARSYLDTFSKLFDSDFDRVVKEVEEAIEEDRVVLPYTISDSDTDRHNDTIDVKGWELKDYNGVVLWAHNHRIPAIGKSIKTWVYGGKLKALKAFTTNEENPFGFQIGNMVKSGFITDASVGMDPLEWDIAEDRDDGKSWFPPINYKKQALLESSTVNVGANPRAKVELSAMSLGVLEESGTNVGEFLRNMEKQFEYNCKKYFLFQSREETAKSTDAQKPSGLKTYKIDPVDLQNDFREKFHGG